MRREETISIDIGREIELVVGEVEFKGKPQETVLVKPSCAKKPPPKPKPFGGDINDEIAF